jgi:hypothetical protein
MNLFRSEEHASRWLGGRAPGETTSVVTLTELARAWYSDRLAPDWKPRTAEQNQAIFDRLGLTGDFWRLPGRRAL